MSVDFPLPLTPVTHVNRFGSSLSTMGWGLGFDEGLGFALARPPLPIQSSRAKSRDLASSTRMCVHAVPITPGPDIQVPPLRSG